MLLTKTVITKWHGKTIKHYIEKGYIYTKMGDEFEVKVEDLTNGSHIKVNVVCDCCNKILDGVKWQDYLKCIKETNKYYCKICVKKICTGEKTRMTKLKSGMSFGYWCIKNLPIREAINIITRWDDELNNCDIREVSYSSNGFNKKGYWFKCGNNPNHKSELQKINSFTSGKQLSIECGQCNSFAQYLLNMYGESGITKYWSNKNTISPWKISYGSKEKIYCKCINKDYHYDYKISPIDFVSGHRCPLCCNYHGKVHPSDSLGALLENRGLLHLWSSKNKKSPYEYSPNSGQRIWLKCGCEKHEDYKRDIASNNKRDFRCPYCSFSKGETRIEEYLKTNNIKYEPQKEFEGLIGLKGGNLSYDFYLPQYNLLIEYQGEFHDGTVPNQSKKDFKKQVEHDRRKKEYAETNNIELLEIWYWDYDNIEEILDKKLLLKKEVIQCGK